MTARPRCAATRCRQTSVRNVKLRVKTLTVPVEVPLCNNHLSEHNESAARLRVESNHHPREGVRQ